MKNSTIVALFTVVLLCALQTALSLGQECNSDDNCNFNEYCYETRYCANCEDCKRFHREEGKNKCSKKPQQCGVCIEGYAENIKHDRYDRERASYCVIATNISTSIVPSDKNINENSDFENGFWKTFTIVIPIIVAVMIIIFVAYKLISKFWPKEYTTAILRSVGRISENNDASPAENLPLSTPSAPPYVPDILVKDNPPPYSQCQFINENRHNAVMERRPNYVSETDIPADNLDDPENNEENNNAVANPVLPVDEITQPSSWTPAPSNESAPSLRTNFLNCLSTTPEETQAPTPERQSNRRPPADPEPARPSKRQRGSRTDVNVNVSNQQIQTAQNNIINVINLGRMPHHFATQTTTGSTQPEDMHTTHHLTLPAIQSGADQNASGSIVTGESQTVELSRFNRNVPFTNNESNNIRSPIESHRYNSSDDDD